MLKSILTLSTLTVGLTGKMNFDLALTSGGAQSNPTYSWPVWLSIPTTVGKKRCGKVGLSPSIPALTEQLPKSMIITC